MSNDVIEHPSSSPASRVKKPSAAKSWLKAIELTSRIEAEPSRLFADVVEDWSRLQPDRTALISETSTLSYRALACPVILRFSAALEATETFKQKKQQLIREGFDPLLLTDPLFYRDPRSGAYRPLDAAGYARIVDGSIRL